MEHKRFKIISAILKLVLLIVILVGAPLYVYFCHHEIIDAFSDISYIEGLLEEYKTQSIFIYLAVQVLQIVFCFLPGQAIQLAGGYMYGFWLGYLLSIVGAGLGTIVTYYVARFLGKDALHMIFSEEKISSFEEMIRGKKGIATLILLYLIPGFPKDVLTYVTGISEFRLRALLVISLVARTPAMMGSLLIGNQLVNGNYTSAIIIGIVAAVLFVLGLIFRNKVMEIFDKMYDKIIKL